MPDKIDILKCRIIMAYLKHFIFYFIHPRKDVKISGMTHFHLTFIDFHIILKH